MKLYAPWEKAFNKIATPFEHFIHSQTTLLKSEDISTEYYLDLEGSWQFDLTSKFVNEPISTKLIAK